MKNIFRFRTAGACAGIALCALALQAGAQPTGAMPMPADHSAMAGHAAGVPASASTRAFQEADRKMMKDMAQPYTGDADKDFVARMIPHHEGAVGMAQIQLQYGKDPALRKMAQDIIKAQREEIDFMKQWQARHGVK